MDQMRTELMVGTLIAERQRQARQQALVDEVAPVGPAPVLAGRLGRLLVRVGRHLESIECDRLSVPGPYAVGGHASD